MKDHRRDVIRKFFAAHAREVRDLIVKITTELVAQRTVNVGREHLAAFPWLSVPGEESLACAVCARYFREWGIEHRIHEGTEKRGNILARLGSGSPTLMMGCHLDVVPPGKGWKTKPFVLVEKEVEVKGERQTRLFGRGVLDNKGPMAASMVAAFALKRAGVPLKGTFLVAGIASEEYRDPKLPDPGIAYLMKRRLMKPDMAVIPDIGENMRKIDVAEKGRTVLRVRTIGKQAHGSTPEQGINAAAMMARVLTALEGYVLPHEPHAVLGAPSMNVGTIHGGQAANQVCPTCVCEVDVRFVPGQTAESVRRQVARIARGAVARYAGTASVGVRVSIDSQVGPHEVRGAAGTSLIAAVQASVKDALGFAPVTFGIGGGTFAKTFNLNGIPAVGFGPGDEDQFHVVDENVSLQELMQFSEVAALMTCDLL